MQMIKQLPYTSSQISPLLKLVPSCRQRVLHSTSMSLPWGPAGCPSYAISNGLIFLLRQGSCLTLWILLTSIWVKESSRWCRQTLPYTWATRSDAFLWNKTRHEVSGPYSELNRLVGRVSPGLQLNLSYRSPLHYVWISLTRSACDDSTRKVVLRQAVWEPVLDGSIYKRERLSTETLFSTRNKNKMESRDLHHSVSSVIAKTLFNTTNGKKNRDLWYTTPRELIKISIYVWVILASFDPFSIGFSPLITNMQYLKYSMTTVQCRSPSKSTQPPSEMGS